MLILHVWDLIPQTMESMHTPTRGLSIHAMYHEGSRMCAISETRSIGQIWGQIQDPQMGHNPSEGPIWDPHLGPLELAISRVWEPPIGV